MISAVKSKPTLTGHCFGCFSWSNLSPSFFRIITKRYITKLHSYWNTLGSEAQPHLRINLIQLTSGIIQLEKEIRHHTIGECNQWLGHRLETRPVINHKLCNFKRDDFFTKRRNLLIQPRKYPFPKIYFVIGTSWKDM